jgi:hypothetical protein
MKPYVIGLLWDAWTPQVESQLTRDVLSLQDEASKWGKQALAVSAPEQANRVLRALDIQNVGELSKLATFWRIYQTGDMPPPAPDWAADQMVYVLKQDQARIRMEDKRNQEIYLRDRTRDINYDPFSRRPMHPGVAPESPWIVLF